jgi:hypothetical protein
MQKCKNAINTVAERCIASEKCISSHRDNPVFLEAISNILGRNGVDIKNIGNTYKKTKDVDVSQRSLEKYTIVKKIVSDRISAKYEYEIGRTLNELKGEINNFCYTFESLRPEKGFLIEHIAGKPLAHFILKRSSENDKKYLAIFLQIFIALYVAFTRFGFVHNDLHSGNVMIVDLGKEEEIVYPIRLLNKTYCIRTRYFPVIIDYGLSQKFSGGKIIIDDMVQHDFTDGYCIPVRDFIRLAGSGPYIQDILAILDILDTPTMRIIANQYPYNILPAFSKLRLPVEVKKRLYQIRHDDIIDRLYSRLNDSVFIRGCMITDFDLLPTFIKEKTHKSFVKAYLSLFSKKGSSGMISDRVEEWAHDIYDELRNTKTKNSYFRDIHNIRNIRNILTIQERACMIPFEKRGMIDKAFLQIKKWIDKMYLDIFINFSGQTHI